VAGVGDLDLSDVLAAEARDADRERQLARCMELRSNAYRLGYAHGREDAGTEPNPRAELPPAVRRIRIARRKRATRRS
jgi:hypothetical protein